MYLTANDYAFRLGEHARLRRQKMGYTQQELADRAGVSRRLVCMVEAGEAEGISLGKIAPILDVLGFTITLSPRVEPPTQGEDTGTPSGSLTGEETKAYLDSILNGPSVKRHDLFSN